MKKREKERERDIRRGMEKVAAGRLVNFDFLSLLLHHPKRATTSTINVCLAVLPFVDLFYICIYHVRRSFLHFASVI